MTYPKFLLWVDFETTGLPKGNDYSDVHILEVAALLTSIEYPYHKYGLYYETLTPTKESVAALKSNIDVFRMHRESGLLEDWKNSPAENTVAYAQESILLMLENNDVRAGGVAIAGSGVAAYDFPLIKEHMPLLAAQLAYFSFDVGMFRRLAHSFLPEARNKIPDTPASYGNGDKKHRAKADIEAHYAEALAFAQWLQKLQPPF